MTVRTSSAASFRVFFCLLDLPWRLPATARQECRSMKTLSIIESSIESRWDGTARTPSRERGSLPIPRAMVRAWRRQRGNSTPPIRGRTDRTTHAAMASAIACSRVQRLCQQSPPGNLPSSRACPHTAFVLTWFKLKERQTSVNECPRSPNRFHRKAFPACDGNRAWMISTEIRRKQTNLPRGVLRPSELDDDRQGDLIYVTKY